jgi:hypothetical protein
MDNKPNLFREAKLQWAGSREINLGSGRGRTFFLTSLFIELIETRERVLRDLPSKGMGLREPAPVRVDSDEDDGRT